MRRLRLPLLLLLALLLGWGAVEGGVALGDRLSHGLGTATDLRPGSGSDAPATPVVEPATEWTAASAAALADLRAERRRQRQAARLRHAVPESASGPVSPAEAGAGATSAAQDPRSASAAAFRRAMRRFGAGLGLTPPDPLASLAGDPGAHDSSIVPGDPWSRRDPSLEGPDAPGRGTP
ncbi:MAG: hypothetical protein RLZZ127_3281, partial [Planctomycetota bacterium]